MVSAVLPGVATASALAPGVAAGAPPEAPTGKAYTAPPPGDAAGAAAPAPLPVHEVNEAGAPLCAPNGNKLGAAAELFDAGGAPLPLPSPKFIGAAGACSCVGMGPTRRRRSAR